MVQHFCQNVLLNYLANISLIKRYGCMANQSPLFVHSNQMRKQTRITQISVCIHEPFYYAVLTNSIFISMCCLICL